MSEPGLSLFIYTGRVKAGLERSGGGHLTLGVVSLVLANGGTSGAVHITQLQDYTKDNLDM